MVATARTGDSIPMAPYYRPGEHRTQQLTARIPKSIKGGLEKLSRAWSHMEQYREGDDEIEVSISDVVVRLLGEGLDGAWAEIGFEPETEEEWQELFRRMEKAIDAAKLAKRPAIAAEHPHKKK